MYNFLNDYSQLAHPQILEEMMKNNWTAQPGYYTDSHSENARNLIRKEIGDENAGVYFVTGGTIANVIGLTCALKPCEAVIAPSTGHISIHEVGSVESTGFKVIETGHVDGKITPEMIQEKVDYYEGIHMLVPKIVYVSNSTELGSVYTKAEMQAIAECCRKNGLFLFCDGARIGYAMASGDCDLTLKDVAELTDAFFIGGTKNGALLGEALVVTNPEYAGDLVRYKKQRGTLLAKGTVVGIQFEQLFKDGLYYRLAEHGQKMAERIVKAMKDKEYEFLTTPQSNQIFPILPVDKIEKLEEMFTFTRWEKAGDTHYAIRIVTSWATDTESVEALTGAL